MNQVGTSTSPALDENISHSPNGSFRVDGTFKQLNGHCSDGQAVTRLPHPISASAAGVHVDFWYRRSGDLPTNSVQNFNNDCDPDSGSTYGIISWGMRPANYGVEVYGSSAPSRPRAARNEKIKRRRRPMIHVHVELQRRHGKVVIFHDCTNVYEDDDLDTSCASSKVKTLFIGMLQRAARRRTRRSGSTTSSSKSCDRRHSSLRGGRG